MTDGLRLTRAMAKVYGKKGGDARAATIRWNVEGEQLNARDVGLRLGIKHRTAQRRMKRLRDNGIPLTWGALSGRKLK